MENRGNTGNLLGSADVSSGLHSIPLLHVFLLQYSFTKHTFVTRLFGIRLHQRSFCRGPSSSTGTGRAVEEVPLVGHVDGLLGGTMASQVEATRPLAAKTTRLAFIEMLVMRILIRGKFRSLTDATDHNSNATFCHSGVGRKKFEGF